MTQKQRKGENPKREWVEEQLFSFEGREKKRRREKRIFNHFSNSPI